MISQSRLPDISFLGRRTPGSEEIEALLEMLPQATLLVDGKQKRVLFANTRATQLTGRSREEISEIELDAISPILDDDLFQSVLESGSARRELTITNQAGAEIHTRGTFTSLGSPKRWTAITLEPTSQLQLEEGKLELREQRWQALQILATAPQQRSLKSALTQILQAGHLLTGASLLAIYKADKQNSILRRSAVWGTEETLPDRIPPSQVSQLQQAHLWKPGEQALSSLHRTAKAAGLNYMATIPLDLTNPSDGILVVADQVATAPKEIDVFLQLITATITTAAQYHMLSKHIEERLLHQSQHNTINDTIMKVVNDGIIQLTPDLQIHDINEAAETLLGYSFEETRGQAIDRILVGTKELLAAIRASKEEIRPKTIEEVKLHHRDGRTILAHIQIAPLTSGDEIDKLILLITDLSEHEEIRSRVQQLEQRALLGEGAAIFAHEVRNPINNISTSLQLMAMNLPNDDPLQRQVNRMQQDCTRLTHLMDSVLSFSNTREYKIEEIDLGLLIRRLLDRRQPRLARAKVEHRLEVAPQTPLVMGDKRAIEQVFTNLISNAAQAMSNQGGLLAIRIRQSQATEDPNMVEVSISDTGPGIPEEIRAQIFKPFFTTSPQGTGLGLTITQRIITAHKGHIEVESFPGGTVFHIKLPKANTTEYQTVQGETA